MNIYLGIAVALLGSLPKDVLGNGCHLRELDFCAAAAAGINKVPVTDEEIDRCCSMTKEVKHCVFSFFDRCATPLQREIINFITEGPIKIAERFCVKGDELRNQYLQQAGCLAKAQPNAKVCFEDVRAGLERLEVAKFDDRIPMACCIYRRYRRCVIGVIEKQCGKEIIEFGELVAKMIIGNTVNVVCQSYDSNPICNAILPLPGTKATGHSKSILSKLLSVYTLM